MCFDNREAVTLGDSDLEGSGTALLTAETDCGSWLESVKLLAACKEVGGFTVLTLSLLTVVVAFEGLPAGLLIGVTVFAVLTTGFSTGIKAFTGLPAGLLFTLVVTSLVASLLDGTVLLSSCGTGLFALGVVSLSFRGDSDDLVTEINEQGDKKSKRKENSKTSKEKPFFDKFIRTGKYLFQQAVTSIIT